MNIFQVFNKERFWIAVTKKLMNIWVLTIKVLQFILYRLLLFYRESAHSQSKARKMPSMLYTSLSDSFGLNFIGSSFPTIINAINFYKVHT